MCSHENAHQYYANSIIGEGMVTYPCAAYRTFIDGNCATDESNEIPMGHHTPDTARGNHYTGIATENLTLIQYI